MRQSAILITAFSAAFVAAQGVSPNGVCGRASGFTCLGSNFGPCCNGARNKCGRNFDDCVGACQPAFGQCNFPPNPAAFTTANGGSGATTSAGNGGGATTTSAGNGGGATTTSAGNGGGATTTSADNGGATTTSADNGGATTTSDDGSSPTTEAPTATTSDDGSASTTTTSMEPTQSPESTCVDADCNAGFTLECNTEYDLTGLTPLAGVNDYAGCVDACTNNDNCYGFTFDGTSSCYSIEDVAALVPSTVNGATSGTFTGCS